MGEKAKACMILFSVVFSPLSPPPPKICACEIMMGSAATKVRRVFV